MLQRQAEAEEQLDKMLVQHHMVEVVEVAELLGEEEAGMFSCLVWIILTMAGHNSGNCAHFCLWIEINQEHPLLILSCLFSIFLLKMSWIQFLNSQMPMPTPISETSLRMQTRMDRGSPPPVMK